MEHHDNSGRDECDVSKQRTLWKCFFIVLNGRLRVDLRILISILVLIGSELPILQRKSTRLTFVCAHLWCMLGPSNPLRSPIKLSSVLSVRFQIADSDADESGSVLQAVGHGGCSPPHVPHHKAPAEGEGRGQVGQLSVLLQHAYLNLLSTATICQKAEVSVWVEKGKGLLFFHLFCLLLKQPTYNSALILMTHDVHSACL